MKARLHWPPWKRKKLQPDSGSSYKIHRHKGAHQSYYQNCRHFVYSFHIPQPCIYLHEAYESNHEFPQGHEKNLGAGGFSAYVFGLFQIFTKRYFCGIADAHLFPAENPLCDSYCHGAFRYYQKKHDIHKRTCNNRNRPRMVHRQSPYIADMINE